MADFYTQDPAGELLYTFDFTPDVPAGVTVTNIAITVPSPLVGFSETPDYLNRRKTIGLRGFVHGELYTIVAVAELNNTERVPKTLIVRGFKAA